MDIETLTRERLMLARLTISEWGVHKVDKQATEKVHSEFAASADSGRYNKLLLPKEALEEIKAVRNEARTLFYKHTLPWQDDGFRVLTAEAYFDLINEISTCASRFDTAVSRLIGELDKWKAQARISQGALYRESDYPTAEEIASKYSMDLALLPMPSGADFRVDMDDVTRARIQADIDARVSAAIDSAMKEVYDRILTTVGHMAEKLADPKAIFRNSLVENVRELIEMVPKLNATGDPRLQNLPEELQGLIAHSAQELRENPTARADTAKAARSMVDRVASWL